MRQKKTNFETLGCSWEHPEHLIGTPMSVKI